MKERIPPAWCRSVPHCRSGRDTQLRREAGGEMYSFVKGGSRLYVKGRREEEDEQERPSSSSSTRQLAVRDEPRQQMASASQESRETFRTQQMRSGIKTVHTSRVVRKTTTVTAGEEQTTAVAEHRSELRAIRSSDSDVKRQRVSR